MPLLIMSLAFIEWPPAEVRVVTRAMNDYQRLLALLEDWEHESARIILGPDRLTPRNRER